MADQVLTKETNERGIPKVKFIENLEEFLKDEGSADNALKKMQDNYSKYKYMETQLAKNKKSLVQKIPDLKSTLEMVKHLVAKKAASEQIETMFELSDAVYANAKITPSTCYLWLGANVMLEYQLDEAEQLLTNNLASAEKNLKTLNEDLGFVKEQITTTEVNIARIFNYDVKMRRQQKQVK